MPYRETPWVRQGQVVTAAGAPLRIDTPAWFAWLETASAFCYTSSQGGLRLTAYREKRRQQMYWYGYARNAGKLHVNFKIPCPRSNAICPGFKSMCP